ncbi:MAG: PAS domain-containing protein, partial [Microvirga sp.]
MLSLNDLAPVLAFSDALGEALYALDRDWRVAAANEAARRWLGSDAIVGRLYWDLVPGARGTVVETAFRSAMAGRERVDVEAASSVHPGRFARGVVIPLADGLAVSFRDVTEEHSARERALAESEERLRLATEAASIGTWDVDATTG